MAMYKNLAGNVGICSYEFREDAIRINFHTRKSVIFDHKHTGGEHINKMKTLALQGFGLNHYIKDHVKDQYAAKLD